MKLTKKLIALFLTLAMVFTLGVAVFATEPGGDPATPPTGSITIKNASKGETYKLYKLFDAEVDPNDPTNVVYYDNAGLITGTNAYFAVGTDKVVTPLVTPLSKDAIEFLGGLVAGATPSQSVIGDGGSVVFSDLPLGYYYITSTLGAAVTIDTTNTDVVLEDKNTKDPEWHPEDPEKPNDKKGKTIIEDGVVYELKDFNIGDTVTFQIKIDTVNFVGSKQVTSYLIGDVFPAGLEFKGISSVTVNGEAAPYVATTPSGSTLAGFPIKVPWVDFTKTPAAKDYYESIYNSGAVLTITYTAEVLDTAVIDSIGNVNTAEFNYKLYDPENPPTTPDDPEDPENPGGGDGEKKTDTATVDTYALAIQKVNAAGTPLAGATFTLPFSVVAGTATDADDVYIVSQADGATTTVTTTGKNILIKGVAAGTYSVTESTPPTGYQKPSKDFSVPAQKIGSATTTKTTYLDKYGNVTDTQTDTTVTYTNDNLAATVTVIVNKTGELPSTGGIGTTIFYIVGAILLVGAAVLLIAKKRSRTE